MNRINKTQEQLTNEVVKALEAHVDAISGHLVEQRLVLHEAAVNPEHIHKCLEVIEASSQVTAIFVVPTRCSFEEAGSRRHINVRFVVELTDWDSPAAEPAEIEVTAVELGNFCLLYVAAITPDLTNLPDIHAYVVQQLAAEQQ